MEERASVLVLGMGNTLLSDDGAGVHVARLLAQSLASASEARNLAILDGGTLGLALLGEIADANALIVIDAARFGERPGAVRIFEGDAFDARVRSGRASVHDLALAELIDAARLTDALPRRRALIGIEPASVEWGLSPTAPVLAALPQAAALAREYALAWTHPAVLETIA